jgi:hypothetical protein
LEVDIFTVGNVDLKNVAPIKCDILKQNYGRVQNTSVKENFSWYPGVDAMISDCSHFPTFGRKMATFSKQYYA